MADKLGGCVLLCLQTTKLLILIQIFMQWLSWITVTSAYVNIFGVFTTASHQLAVVGAILFFFLYEFF